MKVSAFVGGVQNSKAFQVSMPSGGSHTFDSFECAIHALAPACEYCNVKVIGHGIEANDSFYRCAHCVHGRRGRRFGPGLSQLAVLSGW